MKNLSNETKEIIKTVLSFIIIFFLLLLMASTLLNN